MPCFIIIILIGLPHRQIQVLLLNRMGNDNILPLITDAEKCNKNPFFNLVGNSSMSNLSKVELRYIVMPKVLWRPPFLSFAFIPSYYIWLWRVLNIILPIDLYIHFNNAENILWHIKKLWYFCEVWSFLNANIWIFSYRMYYYWQKIQYRIIILVFQKY